MITVGRSRFVISLKVAAIGDSERIRMLREFT